MNTDPLIIKARVEGLRMAYARIYKQFKRVEDQVICNMRWSTIKTIL